MLPEGVAIDPDGQPTRDPTAARLGALLPFGGYKGYGLGFIVQALGVLAGSGMDLDADDGYLFVVFKPDLLVPLDEFKREVTALIDRVKSVPRAPGVEENPHSRRTRVQQPRTPAARGDRCRPPGLRRAGGAARLITGLGF